MNTPASSPFTASGSSGPSDVYTLKIIAATADPDVSKPKWTPRIEEIHRLASPLAARFEQDGEEGAVVLYPDHPSLLEISFDGAPPAAGPEGGWLLEGRFKDARREHLRLPFEILLMLEDD